jgi:hypothetical protein
MNGTDEIEHRGDQALGTSLVGSGEWNGPRKGPSLSDPTTSMRDKPNRIKGREPWRPLAAILSKPLRIF